MKPTTPREEEVLAELLTGARNKEIARRLGISPFTVREHIHNLTSRLGCKNRVDLAMFWAKHRISIKGQLAAPSPERHVFPEEMIWP